MLKIFRDATFSIVNEIDLVDTFTGNGVTTSFTLSNKVGLRIGASVQAESIVYNRYNGGFTLAGDTFTLSSAPPSSSQIVAPGISALVMAAFDQAVVDGVVNPRVKETSFYVGNIDDIHNEYYEQLPATPGISLLFTDLISAAGAQTSWVQLACATQDLAGTAMTYTATGATLYTAELSAFGTVASSMWAGTTSLITNTASSFYIGDYIIINRGDVTQEVCKIVARSGTTLTITATNYAHSVGVPVYACARKFWAKLTIPLNATGNVAANFYDMGLRLRGVVASRV